MDAMVRYCISCLLMIDLHPSAPPLAEVMVWITTTTVVTIIVGGALRQDGKNAFLIYSLMRLSCHFSSRRPSPSYENGPPPRSPNEDSEARSVFVSQLAARMTAKDLGYFFEEHLGEGSVIDPRIVTDRLSRRSKGLACRQSALVSC